MKSDPNCFLNSASSDGAVQLGAALVDGLASAWLVVVVF
jgi:hypothetical protein